MASVSFTALFILLVPINIFLEAVRMDKSTAHPSIVVEEGGTKLSVDGTNNGYAST